MTKEVHKPASPRPKKPAGGSVRSAVLSALSLLSASMGLSLNDVATADDRTKILDIQDAATRNGAKTHDKNYSAMKGYVEGRKVKPGGSTGPTLPPKPTSGSHK